jgi:hypothetical protein
VHLPYAGRCRVESGKPTLHLRMCDVTQPHASPARPYVPCDDPLVAVASRGGEVGLSRQPVVSPIADRGVRPPRIDERATLLACLDLD